MTSLAHAGHGLTDGNSWLHYVTDPMHLPFTLGAAALVVCVTVWVFRRRRSA